MRAKMRVAARRRTTRIIGLALMTLDLEPARPPDRVDAFVRRLHHWSSQPAFANVLLWLPTISGLHPLQETAMTKSVQSIEAPS